MSDRPRPIIAETASCACGVVTLSAKGPVLSMFCCSCEDCQKATGTGHSVVALMRRADITVAGEVTAFSRPAASGASFTRHFCPSCGTPICGSSTRAPELTMLPVGLFGGRSEWYSPTQLIFARSHRAWDYIAAELQRHETYRHAVAAGGG